MGLKERNESMRDFFDSVADGYDEVHSRLMDTKRALIDALPKSCQRILDLGIGTGLELYDLFEKIPTAHVVGIDISDKMLSVLSKRPFADKVKIIRGDYFEVDFGTNFDAVISSSSLHHFEASDKLTVYKKVFSALRSGGVFINSDCIANTVEEERAAYDEMVSKINTDEHIDTPLAKKTEEKILKLAGFTDISFKNLENPLYKLFFASKTV